MKALEIALVATLTAVSAYAWGAQGSEEAPARAGHEVMAPVTWHHQMPSLMRELAQEIELMGTRMEEAAPVRVHRRLAERMDELSWTLAKMSGLLARPGHAVQDTAWLADMRRTLRIETNG